jgi:hypothetical protein
VETVETVATGGSGEISDSPLYLMASRDLCEQCLTTCRLDHNCKRDWLGYGSSINYGREEEWGDDVISGVQCCSRGDW